VSLRRAFLNLWNEIKMARMMRDSAKSFQALKGKMGLNVHLGCGQDIKLGWVNIDLVSKSIPRIDPNAHPDTIFINHDLRIGLPLNNNSCKYIYSSHFFEHLKYQDGVKLMHDCYRALELGGIFRIAIPNFREIFYAYLCGDWQYFELINASKAFPEIERGTETLIDYINYAVYQHGEHRCIYDEEKLILLLHRVGFSSVAKSLYMDDIDPDSPSRRRYSLYIEAIK
jgi:predicted SAM-dependent methyltransferase